ncbi:MAG: ATP-binding protein, partial [Spirochaetaceae bacterium]
MCIRRDSVRQKNIDGISNIIMIMSGKGGVGKSTVSVNTAGALAAAGYRTGLLDVDFHGPSAAKMTGIEGVRLEAAESGKPTPIKAAENLYV